MSRVIFTEHQSFRQVMWIWLIVIPVSFISVISVLYGFYHQVIGGEPWGNQPMSDGGLTVALISIVVVNTGVIWLLASVQLDVEITKDEFRYKYFRFKNWNVLTRGQIRNYSVDKFTIWKGRGLGFHVNLMSKTERMIIKPSALLTLTVSGRRTIIQGTEKREELERAMQKLMSPGENF